MAQAIGCFSFVGIIEADNGFPQSTAIIMAEFTNHIVTERHIPEHARTLRSIIHNDCRQDTNTTAGDGRFLITEMPGLMSLTVQLPVVKNDPENDMLRNQTLASIAKSVRRRKHGKKVLIQGDWNVD